MGASPALNKFGLWGLDCHSDNLLAASNFIFLKNSSPALSGRQEHAGLYTKAFLNTDSYLPLFLWEGPGSRKLNGPESCGESSSGSESPRPGLWNRADPSGMH